MQARAKAKARKERQKAARKVRGRAVGTRAVAKAQDGERAQALLREKARAKERAEKAKEVCTR